MAEKETERAAPVGGILLLFLGIILLLQTTGYLSWGLWDNLWPLWPVLIIITGVSLLLRRVSPWLVSLLVLVILAGCLIYAYQQTVDPAFRETIGLLQSGANLVINR